MREHIRTLKERIKKLGALQPILKRLRKTTLEPDERKALEAKLDKDCGTVEHGIPWEVIRRRIRITAYLNLYRHLRGKDQCHNIREGGEYYYDKEMKALCEEFKLEIAPPHPVRIDTKAEPA